MGNNKSILSPLEILTADGNAVEIVPLMRGTAISAYSLPLFSGLTATGGYGNMHFFHYTGAGFSIWYSKYSISAKTHFTSRGDFPVLELSIPFNRQFNSVWDKSLSNASREKQFVMASLPYVNTRAVFEGAGDYSTFDIHYSREYLQRFAPEYPQLDKFLGLAEGGHPAILTGHANILTPAMIQLVQDILQCNLPPSVAGYFYESCALLMLIRVLDSKAPAPRNFSAFEIDRVNEVRELLTKDPSVRYSITVLAQIIGLNETTLQQCFKQEFGTTVFDYGQLARLDYAKWLLLDTQDTIQSIAEKCGYPDQTNLTVAFKKKFGCTPVHFRSIGKNTRIH